MSDEWLDDSIESFRNSDAWLLDWRAEIEAVIRYAGKPVHPANITTIDPADVVPRLGPALTVMARAARSFQEGAVEYRDEYPDHPDTRPFEYRAWGARQVLALGLGAHLQLSREQADWLATALTGADELRTHVEKLRSARAEDAAPPENPTH